MELVSALVSDIMCSVNRQVLCITELAVLRYPRLSISQVGLSTEYAAPHNKIDVINSLLSY